MCIFQEMFLEPSTCYGRLGRYNSYDTNVSLASINRSLTLPRNSSNKSNHSTLAKKQVPSNSLQDGPANTLVLSCDIFDIPTVGDLIDPPVDIGRLDPPTNFSDDAINRQDNNASNTVCSAHGKRLDCKKLVSLVWLDFKGRGQKKEK